MKAQAIQPTVWVPNCFKYSTPVKFFFYHCIAVRGQSSLNEFPLGFRKELGSIWIVLDEPVRDSSHNDGGNPFLDDVLIHMSYP